ncbi:hypothetical protein P153DRAFT_320693 [Dothidotthia symphoricarpi CBS 119687]|uniref:Uncharacterized protein n=1 Tax=Dothidotthia symphoricarpi CBS 119687 TaxID=1392245 RepID=A0A6A6A6K0_9PLEO|nr:uncharacterized protein P153DRAFT_320693 [Dothidotthia symphoricarpi CBS 119687]KAF2127186.1 hypothetical protein P153DRAFT_320693 [Dothidotthia symphoricarpi CBS 119687]
MLQLLVDSWYVNDGFGSITEEQLYLVSQLPHEFYTRWILKYVKLQDGKPRKKRNAKSRR